MFTEETSNKMEKRAFAESLYWAGVLIWAGLVFAADGLNLLPTIGNADAWTWLFTGAGLYGTLMNLYGTFSPDPVTTGWDYIWSGFWLVLGVSSFVTSDVFWPLALILVGVVTLVNAVRGR